MNVFSGALPMNQDSRLSIGMLDSGAFTMSSDGRLHCKTVPYYIFAQAQEGSYELTAGNGHARLSEGEAFLTAPNIPLKIWHWVNPGSGNMKVRYLHFRFLMMDTLDPLDAYSLPLRADKAASDRIGRHVSRIIELAAEEYSLANHAEKMSCAFSVLAEICRISGRKNNMHESIGQGMMDVLEYIEKHKFSGIGTEELPKMAGMSRAVFFREFRKITHESPAKYMMRLRMEAAAHILCAKPDISVSELSGKCGFRTQFHFSRCFKAAFGCAPKEFRIRSSMK